MRLPEDYERNAPVALPPITLPRYLVNRLNIVPNIVPEIGATAEWTSATLAYVLDAGLDALDATESAPVPDTLTAGDLADLRDKASRSEQYRSWWLMAEERAKS